MINVKLRIDKRDNKEVFAILLDHNKIIRWYREKYNFTAQYAYSIFWIDFKNEEEMFNILAECNVVCSNHGIVILKRRDK